MRILLDTNVLLRLWQLGHHNCTPAEESIASLRGSGNTLCIVPQNLYEYWAVATRPLAANGLGASVNEATEQCIRIKQLFELLDDEAGLCAKWESLVSTHDVIGKSAHEAHLVAAMMLHGVDDLLTFNVSDFQRFKSIHVRSPFDLDAP